MRLPHGVLQMGLGRFQGLACGGQRRVELRELAEQPGGPGDPGDRGISVIVKEAFHFGQAFPQALAVLEPLARETQVLLLARLEPSPVDFRQLEAVEVFFLGAIPLRRGQAL